MGCKLSNEEIYLQYKDKVLGYIRNHVNSPEDAEDLCSDVFIKIYSKLDTFDETKASLSTWIYAMTSNTVIDFYRTNHVHSEIPEDLAEEGDVLVIDGNGCLTRSLMGEMMFNYAYNRGIAGIVVDGAIRDSDSLKTLPLPVYAAGITPQGPYKNGPGEINIPVSCGGQVVFPGDIIVGDADGVVVIHAADAPKIIAAAQKKYENELERLKCYHTMGNIDAESHNKKFTELMEKLHTTVYQEDSRTYYEN